MRAIAAATAEASRRSFGIAGLQQRLDHSSFGHLIKIRACSTSKLAVTLSYIAGRWVKRCFVSQQQPCSSRASIQGHGLVLSPSFGPEQLRRNLSSHVCASLASLRQHRSSGSLGRYDIPHHILLDLTQPSGYICPFSLKIDSTTLATQ